MCKHCRSNHNVVRVDINGNSSCVYKKFNYQYPVLTCSKVYSHMWTRNFHPVNLLKNRFFWSQVSSRACRISSRELLKHHRTIQVFLAHNVLIWPPKRTNMTIADMPNTSFLAILSAIREYKSRNSTA